MRIMIIIFLIVNSLVSVANSEIKFLSNDDKKKILNTPEGEDIKVDVLRKSIVAANTHNGEIIEYYYSCRNIKEIEPKTFFFSSQSMTQFSGKYDVFEWGIVSQTSCSSEVEFLDKTTNKLWLQSCAKAATMALVLDIEYMHNKNINVDYSEWCIIDSKKDHIAIKQLVKFKKQGEKQGDSQEKESMGSESEQSPRNKQLNQ